MKKQKCLWRKRVSFLALLALCSQFLAGASASVPVNSTVQEPLSYQLVEEDVTRRESHVKHFRFGEGGYVAALYSKSDN